MFARDIGIDLGTANVLIYVRGQGIVLDEPSVVAIDSETKKPLLLVGKLMKCLVKLLAHLRQFAQWKMELLLIEITEIMLNYFIKRSKQRIIFTSSCINLLSSWNYTVENAIKEAAERTGAKKVYIAEEAKVAAIGADMDISKPTGNMVIDVGGGTTDVAVLSLGSIVTSESIKVAGNKFDTEIAQYIKDKYKLLIGDKTAEQIKIQIGTVIPGGKKKEWMFEEET